jgi:site-specific DNA-methyltransferase (adenine-specific)
VKPLAVMAWLVRLVVGGRPDAIVLEPFAGSGTTIEACLNEGVQVIGIEREADYLPLIAQRIDRATGKTPAAAPAPAPVLTVVPDAPVEAAPPAVEQDALW